MTTVTNDDLQAARRAVEQARGPYDEALKARRALVRLALEQGMKPAHIARQAGLTWTGVAKIAKSRS
jgi:hypothetical protein